MPTPKKPVRGLPAIVEGKHGLDVGDYDAAMANRRATAFARKVAECDEFPRLGAKKPSLDDYDAGVFTEEDD